MAVGWTVAKIVKQVNDRTENRASGKIDLLAEFFLGLDEFCQEKHYWWRRKVFSFPTVIGQQAYDLTKTGAGNANAPDCIEIEEAFVVNGSVACPPRMVNPAFSAIQTVQALFGQNNIAGCISHASFFINPGTFQTLEFSAPPQTEFTFAATYWAVPMVSDTASQATIPLLPPPLHWGAVYILERRVYEFLYGQNDPRFVTSNARYEQFKNSAAKWKQFSGQEAIHSEMAGHSVVASGRHSGYRGGRR